MPKISQELIDKAKYTNLVAYCQSKGIALKREGREYVLKEYDSLYISATEPWKWYRHSVTDGGKAIDFCTKFLGMDFRTAVAELTQTALPEVSIEPTKYYQPNMATNQKRVIAYLAKKRGLEYKIIVDLIRKGKIREDERGNCVCLIKDFQGNNIGAELHGTGDSRYKGQVQPQDGFGFTLQVGQSVDKVAFFESAIDLVSFYQLYKDSYISKGIGLLLVSMGGLKSAIIANYKEHYTQAEYVLCVDNDERGKAFAAETKIKAVYPPQGKDWNEYLLQRSD